MVEKGGALTSEYLNDTYYRLIKQYYGAAFSFDDQDKLIEVHWGRIPHFYRDYYVYKYAVGTASALDICSRVLAEDQDTARKYLVLLQGGSSKPPLDLLRETGVDLTSDELVISALTAVERSVKELRNLLSVRAGAGDCAGV